MKNPVFKFISLSCILFSPTVYGLFKIIVLNAEVIQTSKQIGTFYVIVFIIWFILSFIWWLWFDNDYKEWKKSNTPTVSENDEIKRLKRQISDLKRQQEDRWDNF